MKAGSDYDGRIPVWDKVCKWRLYLTDGSVVKALAGKGIRGDVNSRGYASFMKSGA
ncbi:predicted protein [Sclerotinia sclerotiorum 1980 UF-70]|uniref:Uncharacterized protein n=1 Tax=Sclerotinia sclerotiorum (strain ATCC 18683 / 1980 / Ss-1) TaxID=665079 RepID=A7EXX2_SCLS1|nr:predicted protein [Sclerotinia sclerotiorum 1980 UF-70]EDN94314.1 predicted protein [Sclerotinia sclerotiorum 1980 UF-70]